MNIGVIPARLNSERFPRKILAPILGKPMIVHVAEQAGKCDTLDKVIIAVDSQLTIDVLKDYDCDVVMTSDHHTSGTDRIGEAVVGMNADVIVNIQGDEPLIDPHIIKQLIEKFEDPDVQMATAVSTILSAGEYGNENIVKAFLDGNQVATSFQRIVNDSEIGGCYKHLGIYAYTKPALLSVIRLPQSKNEKALKLEQWRALDNGMNIHAIITDYPHHGVDVPADLDYVNNHMKQQ